LRRLGASRTRPIARTASPAANPVLPGWDDLEESYRESTRAGVLNALSGATPQSLHESWMAERTRQGWVYGAVLDRTAKIHPNLVPYDQLPPAQRLKDRLFLAVVRALSV
jgi:hypothetical protein